MRELDALNQEIEELRKEKESLTTEIQQKEHSIKTTSLEVQVIELLPYRIIRINRSMSKTPDR